MSTIVPISKVTPVTDNPETGETVVTTNWDGPYNLEEKYRLFLAKFTDKMIRDPSKFLRWTWLSVIYWVLVVVPIYLPVILAISVVYAIFVPATWKPAKVKKLLIFYACLVVCMPAMDAGFLYFVSKFQAPCTPAAIGSMMLVHDRSCNDLTDCKCFFDWTSHSQSASCVIKDQSVPCPYVTVNSVKWSQGGSGNSTTWSLSASLNFVDSYGKYGSSDYSVGSPGGSGAFKNMAINTLWWYFKNTAQYPVSFCLWLPLLNFWSLGEFFSRTVDEPEFDATGVKPLSKFNRILAVVGMVMDFTSYSSFAFGTLHAPSKSAPESTVSWSQQGIGKVYSSFMADYSFLGQTLKDAWVARFWTFWGLYVFYIVATPLIAIWGPKKLAKFWTTKVQSILFDMLLLTSFKNIFSVLSCNYTLSDVPFVYLISNPDVECWTGDHLPAAVMSGLFIPFFFLYCLYHFSWTTGTEEPDDLRFLRQYKMTLVCQNLFLTAVNTVFSQYPLISWIASLWTIGFLLYLNFFHRPCLNHSWVNVGRCGILLSGAWAYACALISFANSQVAEYLYLILFLPVMGLGAFVTLKRVKTGTPRWSWMYVNPLACVILVPCFAMAVMGVMGVLTVLIA